MDDAAAAPNGDIWVTGLIALSPLNGVPLVMRYSAEWDFMEAVELAPMAVEPSAPRNGWAAAVD